MNLLIADSGSTKTDWRFADDSGNIFQYSTQGCNPYQLGENEMAEIFATELPLLREGKIPAEIYFYGAGCGAEEKAAEVKNALLKNFKKGRVEVNTDLLGAARSLCGREAGMVAILGTGSNSCCYDGNKISVQQPSLGFILGDEGSGAVLGKSFLRLYLNEQLDVKLKTNFEKRFSFSTAEILDKIYRQSFPNRFLASFSKFIFQNIDHPQCTELVVENFRLFFDRCILRYPHARNWPLHITGSVGFYFSNLLRRVAEEKNVRLGIISESPIAGLLNYHLDSK